MILWERSGSAPPQRTSHEETAAKPLAGTLGARFFAGRVLALDFEADVLKIYDRMPANVDGTSVPFGSKQSRPTMKVSLNGQPALAMYDTGSSMMEVFVRPELFLELTGLVTADAAPLQVTMTSWANQITIHGAPFEGMVGMGDVLLHPRRIWGGDLMEDMYKANGVEVILGNEIFIGRTVYVDFDNRTFAIGGGE